MKKLNVDISGEFVLHDGEMAMMNDIVVQLTDYYDRHYDVSLVRKETDQLFGNSVTEPFTDRIKALEFALELCEETGLEMRVIVKGSI